MNAGERVRLAGFFAVVALIHVVGWGALLTYAGGHPAFLGLGALAYSFGLRHAFDADHIAAIDNTTRKLLQDGRKPVGAGFFFSLGHSTVVFVIALLLGLAVRSLVSSAISDSGELKAVGSLVGTTVSGWLSDRIDPRKLLAWYYTLRGLALLFLPAAYDMGVPALAGFVVFYGLDWVATVPPTVKLVTERFGKERVGPVFGWVFAAHQLGGSAAAFGAGFSHTWLGDYLVAFLVAGGLCLLAAGLVISIRRSDHDAAPALPPRPSLAS